jgi:hypothetical protein
MNITVSHPPEPKIERITNLVNRIQNGDIKIPKFQRGFVWDEGQILKLLESIYQGYPIGSLLFWLSEQSMKSEKNVGGFDLPQTPEKYPRNYVLDGQQRLTTIYGVLNWPNRKVLHKLNVYFDLEQRKFLNFNGELDDKKIPMSILFKTSDFLRFRTKLSEFPNANELQQSVDILYEVFREYLIPVVTIKEKTVEEVCPIFERINSTGTKLNIFDLMVAATWSDDFDLNEKVTQLRESTKLKDFEDIDNSVFLKFMSSIKGLGAKRDGVFKLRNLKSTVLDDLGHKVKISAERAIDFLSTDLQVPSDAFLPYENQLVVFAYFFSKVLHPDSDQLSALRRWFWQAGFSERYRGAVEGILEQDLSAVDSLLKGDSGAMNVKVSLVENDILKRQFWKNSAFSKTFVVMLANNAPKNLTNGEAIDIRTALSSFNNKEFHHIFPKDFLKKLGVPAERRNAIANICMLSAAQNKCISNDPPSIYLTKSFNNLSQDAYMVFKSNLISSAPDSAWRMDSYELFLKQRGNAILKEIYKLCGL